MTSMVPRGGARGFLKRLNGQSIVGSAGKPSGLTPVAIEGAARYVKTSRDARGWSRFRHDRIQSDKRAARHRATLAGIAPGRGDRPDEHWARRMRRAVS